MRVSETAILLIVTMTTFATAVVSCLLGFNASDSSNSIVVVCSSRGWTVAEICQDDACRLGSRGAAYCQKEAECIPGRSQCDATNCTPSICNELGFWQTNRKCPKPGCCEVQNGWADCKAECGPGLSPPAQFSTRKVHSHALETSGRFPSIGEGF